MNDQIGIYLITTPSGKGYVGMTMDSFSNRWRGHRTSLRSSNHKCKGLQRAALKYDVDSFVWTILEVVSSDAPIEDVLLKEQQWWDRKIAEGVLLYNGRPSGTGSVIHTEETRKRISASMPVAATLISICPGCENAFEHLARKKRKFCSKICAVNNLKSSPTDSLTLEMKNLYESGWTCPAIADLTGLHQDTVLKRLNKIGVQIERGRKHTLPV